MNKPQAIYERILSERLHEKHNMLQLAEIFKVCKPTIKRALAIGNLTTVTTRLKKNETINIDYSNQLSKAQQIIQANKKLYSQRDKIKANRAAAIYTQYGSQLLDDLKGIKTTLRI